MSIRRRRALTLLTALFGLGCGPREPGGEAREPVDRSELVADAAEKQAHCVMLDAEGGIENTDSSSGTLGPACQAAREELAPLPEDDPDL